MAHPKGGYKVNGKRVPGVTTIIGRFKDSGGLLWWAFDQGKAAERGEISSLYDKRDEAAESGTLAHSMVEAHIRGETLPDMSDQPVEIVLQAGQGFENFLQWEQNNKIKIVEQEMQLVSREHLYGGCPDAIGEDAQGRLCLLDWKTSSSIYADYLIQLAAYKHLWEENYPDRPLTGGMYLCRFAKEHADFHHAFFSDLDEAWEQFLLFRRAYEIDKALKKRV